MSPPYGDTIQVMFDISDQIFKAIYTPPDKIYDKKNEILKQLRELKPSESYRHCSPNIQEMFSKSDERYKKSDIRSETEQKELNQLREQQHE